MTYLAKLSSGKATVTYSLDGEVLDAWFPDPRIASEGPSEMAQDESVLDELAEVGELDELRGVRSAIETVEANLQAPPASTADAYLRLHLLSHRLALPNTINLEGIFAVLHTVAWTTAGPVPLAHYRKNVRRLNRAGISLISLDKFPPMLNYVVPEQVRVADITRVRLGAYLSAGTTVMQAGLVNFNAGTLGPAMVEGRISQGVVVGAYTDIGGGASIMGTLSGGGKHRISIGEHTLLGANAGVGISLGDNCIVEAGLYLTAGTKVKFLGQTPATVIKAAELSGQSGLIFRRNSQSGQVEALPTDSGVQLNDSLHG